MKRFLFAVVVAFTDTAALAQQPVPTNTTICLTINSTLSTIGNASVCYPLNDEGAVDLIAAYKAMCAASSDAPCSSQQAFATMADTLKGVVNGIVANYLKQNATPKASPLSAAH